MNINYNTLIKKLIPYLVVIAITYTLSTVLFYFLPKNGVDFIKQEGVELPYSKYDGFYSQKQEIKKVKPKTIKKKETIKTLSNYRLKAIYSTTANGGWISIENRSGSKSFILSQNEQLDGYVLVKLYKNYVVFERDEREYKLEIKEDKKNISYEIQRVVDNVQENVVVSEDNVKVKRPYLNSYVNNIDKVWKDIAIKEIRKNGKIDGFRINRVNRNSVFAKLGLKRGDIIKAVNNNVLKSYADAFAVYNNINKTKYLNIEILRNNETMELNYEID